MSSIQYSEALGGVGTDHVRPYFSCATASAKWYVLGAWTVWAFPSAPATLIHVLYGKVLDEVEYRSKGVVINKYTLSQSK